MANPSNQGAKEKWYKEKVIMGFIGVLLGAIIGFGGTIVSTQAQLKAISLEQEFELQTRFIKKKEDVYTQIVQSIYSLQKMNDGLIETDLATFKNDSYTLMAQVQIYGSDEIAELYDEFLKTFFESHVFDSNLVNTQLIPAIRKDLGIEA